MNTWPFTVEELDRLQVVLNAAMSEAAQQGVEVPLPVMLARLFAAASTGERNPEKLKAAVLSKRNQLNGPACVAWCCAFASARDSPCANYSVAVAERSMQHFRGSLVRRSPVVAFCFRLDGGSRYH